MTKIYTSSLSVGITKHRLNSNCDRCLIWGIGDRVLGGDGRSLFDEGIGDRVLWVMMRRSGLWE